jgi:hypothetical protein
VKEIGCIAGSSTRWTYDTRSLRRAKRLWCYISILDTDKLYFRNKEVKKEWINYRATWARDGTQYLHYMLPVLERIEFWILFFESGRSVTISFCLYAIDDLKYFCNQVIINITKDKENLQHQPAVLPHQESNMKATLLFIINKIDSIFNGFHNDSLLEVAELLDFRVGVPCKSRHDMHPGTFQQPLTKFIKFFQEHKLAKKLFPLNDSKLMYTCNKLVFGSVNYNCINLYTNLSNVQICSFTTFRTNLYTSFNFTDIVVPEAVSPSTYNPFGIGNSPVHARNNDSNNNEKLDKFIEEARQYIAYLMKDFNTLNKDEEKILNRDPLVSWWPKLEGKFPMLSKVAMHILELSGSIAGSERFFSRLSNIITKKRCSLDKTLASRIILHSMRNRHSKLLLYRMKIPPFGVVDNTKDINDDDTIDDIVEDDEVIEDIDNEFDPIEFNDDTETEDGSPNLNNQKSNKRQRGNQCL